MIRKIYGAGTRMCIFDIGMYRVKDPGGGGLPYGTDGDARRKF